MSRKATKQLGQTAFHEHGIHLDVPGRALIAQAAERIAWHKRAAAAMANELTSMAGKPAAAPDDWTQRSRRMEIERAIASHEQRERFLAFVARHLVRNRIYRLSLTDLAVFEIAPR